MKRRNIIFTTLATAAFALAGCAQKNHKLPASLDFSLLEPAFSPPARLDAAMATDFGSGRVFLFGGRNASGGYLSDLWYFDARSTAWKKIESESSPQGRSGASLVWDKENGRLVLFGGARADVYGKISYLRELWFFSEDSGWQREFFETGPSARAWHAAVIVGQKVILYGGYGGEDAKSLRYLNDAWAFDLTAKKFERLNSDREIRKPYRPAMLTVSRDEKLLILGQVERKTKPRIQENLIDLESNEHRLINSYSADEADYRLFLADQRSKLFVAISYLGTSLEQPEGEIWLAVAMTPLFIKQTIENLPSEFIGISCSPHPTLDSSFLCFGGSRREQVSARTWILGPLVDKQ